MTSQRRGCDPAAGPGQLLHQLRAVIRGNGQRPERIAQQRQGLGADRKRDAAPGRRLGAGGGDQPDEAEAEQRAGHVRETWLEGRGNRHRLPAVRPRGGRITTLIRLSTLRSTGAVMHASTGILLLAGLGLSAVDGAAQARTAPRPAAGAGAPCPVCGQPGHLDVGRRESRWPDHRVRPAGRPVHAADRRGRRHPAHLRPGLRRPAPLEPGRKTDRVRVGPERRRGRLDP